MRFWVLICWLLAASAVAAGNLRVATVDMKTLFKEYPGTPEAQKKFEAQAREKKEDLEDSQQDLADLQDELNDPKSPMSRKERERKESEFAKESQDYQNEEKHIQLELDDQEKEMTRMLMDQIKHIVAQVAKNEDIDLILDSDDAVHIKDGTNLTEEILRAFANLTPEPTDADGGLAQPGNKGQVPSPPVLP
ncbi:MAG TPA: OmpH family outer membrane protein [bacterium]|nr:OmpH family outer membrane protein [bacterium]